MCHQVSFWGAPTHAEFQKLLLQLKNQRSGNKTPSILLNKNIKFNKNETELRMENPTYNFRETNLVLQLMQELQIKSKTVISWSWKKKKRAFFCTVYFVRR